jgi:hypothetical protein
MIGSLQLPPRATTYGLENGRIFPWWNGAFASSWPRVLLSCLRFCAPSQLDQAATVFAIGPLPSSYLRSCLLLLLPLPRSPPIISPSSTPHRLVTCSTRCAYCLVHVARLSCLDRLVIFSWSRDGLRDACLCEPIR